MLPSTSTATSTSLTNPIRKALHTLLPPSHPLPPRLLSAAESLLSISRQRAGHLKPDEEIARPHVCAEIACKRLRVHLRLPNIKSGNGAPCRPAVYKKLLIFLEKTLGDVEVVGTPKGKGRTVMYEGGNASGSQTPTTGRSTGKSTAGRKRNIEALDLDDDNDDDDVPIETPTKKRQKTTDISITPSSAKASGKKVANGFLGKILDSTTTAVKGAGLPDLVLPIRKLCTAFKTTKMIPHVYTGVCILNGLQTELLDSNTSDLDAETSSHAKLTLTLAVYLLTLTRMQKGAMTTAIYDIVVEKGKEVLQFDNEKHNVAVEVEAWIAQINEKGWTSQPGNGSDWWSSVPEDMLTRMNVAAIRRSQDTEAEIGIEDQNSADGDGEATPNARQRNSQARNSRQVSRRDELRKQLEDEDPDDVLLPGLGTMMNDMIDYFSEERTAEYESWRADVLRQLDARA